MSVRFSSVTNFQTHILLLMGLFWPSCHLLLNIGMGDISVHCPLFVVYDYFFYLIYMVFWTRVVTSSEVIFLSLIRPDVDSLQELGLYSTCNHKIMDNFRLDMKEGVSATVTLWRLGRQHTEERWKSVCSELPHFGSVNQQRPHFTPAVGGFHYINILFQIRHRLFVFVTKALSPYLACYILEKKMEQRLVSWLYVIYCRQVGGKKKGRERRVAVCLTVHRPCNSLFILWCLKMGFYSQSFYFQIKQSLVLRKPVKGVSKRSQSTQTTQQSVKPVLEPESDRLLSLSVGCLFFPPLSNPSSLHLPHSKHLKECKGREECAREQEGFYLIHSMWQVGCRKTKEVYSGGEN